MKRGMKRRILTVLLAASLVVSQSGAVWAAEMLPQDTLILSEDDSEIMLSEDGGYTEVTTTEGSAGTRADSTFPADAEEISAPGNAEDSTVPGDTDEIQVPEDKADVTVSGNASGSAALLPEDMNKGEVSYDSVTEEASGTVFRGMPKGFALSEAEILGKERIAEHKVASKLETLTPGVDYVEDEVIFSCDDPDYARTVAEAYNGTLESCYLGVAVIKLDKGEVSVRSAVAAGADPSNNLPPVDVNAINHLIDPVESQDVDINDSIQGKSTAKKKGAWDVRNWTYWTKDGGFNDPAFDPGYIYDGNAGDGYKKVNGYQWMHDAVESYRAWGVTRGEGVTVAVIDSGVYAGHEDLGADKVDTSAYAVEPFSRCVDGKGHGTHVAGIIAAKAGNGKGGTGIAPDAKILDIPVFNEKGGGKEDVFTRAINYVINGGNIRAKVINLSLGGPVYSNIVQETITAAHDAGITICAAMGNEYSNNEEFPAAYDHVIAVSAMDESWQKADFSTFGDWADVAAPGKEIFSTWNGHDENNLTVDHDYYGSWEGTSMATPVVAGVCALYISARGGQAAPDEVEAALKKGAKKISSPYKIGKGMVNAASMLESLEETGAPGIAAPADLSGDSKITFSETPDGRAAAGGTIGFIYTLNGKKPSAAGGKITEGFFVDAVNGSAEINTANLLDNGLEANKPVKLTAARITGLGTMTETANVVIRYEDSVYTGMEVIGPEVLAKGKSLTYKVNRAVPKNAPIWMLKGAPAGVTVNAKTGRVSAAKASGGSFRVVAEIDGVRAEKEVKLVEAAKTLTITAPGADKDVNIPVTDRNGNLKSARLYNVDINATGKTENVLDLDGKANDPSIPVEYMSSDTSVAEVDSDGVVKAKKEGSVKITCRAADGSNKQASVTLKVIVPVSRLDMFPDKSQQCVAYGKSMKLRPAMGSAYGTPTIKKVVWKKEPVKVVGYKSSTESGDVTEDAKRYVKISNGNLSVNKDIEKLGYGYYDATVRMEATDGTGLYVEKTYHVVPPTTFIKVNPGLEEYLEGEKEKKGDEGNLPVFRNNVLEIKMDPGEYYELPLFISDLGLDYLMTAERDILSTEVICSNPGIVSSYDCYQHAWYREDNEIKGLVYRCGVTALKKGNATITIMATDGSGKKATLKVRVK